MHTMGHVAVLMGTCSCLLTRAVDVASPAPVPVPPSCAWQATIASATTTVTQAPPDHLPVLHPIDRDAAMTRDPGPTWPGRDPIARCPTPGGVGPTEPPATPPQDHDTTSDRGSWIGH